MSEDLILQEYYCSFLYGIEGSYYNKNIDKARLEGRIGKVPWNSGFKVHVSLDIGVRDSTSLIFFQTIGQAINIIDCYENSKEGLEHYVNYIKALPFTYGTFIAPADIAVKEWGSGMTRLEKAKHLGINFTTAPNLSIMDGIESCRTTLSKCFFDEVKCAKLIKALENYRQEFDIKKKVYKPHPLHNQFSHFADSFRYLCLSIPKTQDGLSAKELERLYNEAMYGENSNLSPIFDNKFKY
jgi:phage terminase large subunit